MNVQMIKSYTRLAWVMTAVAMLAACQATGSTPQAQPVAGLPHEPKFEEFIGTGDPFPIASIVDVNGATVDLAAPDKRKLVILFATWCKDSNRALKALNHSDLLNDETIEVIAIAREENAGNVIPWRDENNIRTPLATDPDRAIFKQFAAAGIPRFITVGPDNKVIKMNLAETEDPLSLIDWHQ